MTTWPKEELRKIAETDAAMRQKAGRITAAGITKEVTFQPVDDAYRAKYKSSTYLSPIIVARARSATVRVTPRDANARK
jgi:hypothetical protein